MQENTHLKIEKRLLTKKVEQLKEKLEEEEKGRKDANVRKELILKEEVLREAHAEI